MTRKAATRSAIIVLATLATAAAAQAQDRVAVSLAKSFVKMCILAVPHLDAVAIRARIEGWKQIEGAEHEQVFYSTSNPTQASWATRGIDDLPIAVTIAKKGDTRVKSMTITCAVQNPDAPAADVAKALADMLPLLPPQPSTTEGDKRITPWTFFYGDRHVGIGLVTDTTTKTGAILSAVITQSTP